MRHVYSIARYVPSINVGKRVSLAVLAGSAETGEWVMRVVRDGARALPMDAAAARAALDAVFCPAASLGTRAPAAW